MTDEPGTGAESLLPYDEWTEAALRGVVLRALEHVGQVGLPGEHHFYITFRTDHPNTVIPERLRAQYPDEMTIVLQNKFWDLKVDKAAEEFSVGLTFGGVPSILHIPFAAVTGFADPHVRFGLRFRAEIPPPLPTPEDRPEEKPEDAAAASAAPQVVSLDAFRRRPATKDS